MKLDDIFDDYGLDGEDNKKAFEKLPKILKYFITSQQNDLVKRVIRNVKQKFGENALKDLVKTSGFRSFSTNQRNGGVVDSLHLFGCACDFKKVGIFEKEMIPCCCNIECIDSGKCWHVQFKRGL